MSKTPYEIRTEVLKLAKSYMDDSWHMNCEFARQMFEQGSKTAEEMQEAFYPYSMDSLMEKAKEMYSFVSDNKK